MNKNIIKSYALLALLISSSNIALASATSKEQQDTKNKPIVTYSFRCTEVLSSKDPVLTFSPPLYSGRHNKSHSFTQPFRFSSDGQWVLISHNYYPDAEQVSIRDTKTGELVSTFVWTGAGGHLFNIWSVAANRESQKVIAHTEHIHSGENDSVLLWDPIQNSVVEVIDVAPPKTEDYITTGAFSEQHSFRSGISTEHPYFIRSNAGRVHKNNINSAEGFIVQIVNWQNKSLLNLPTASVKLLPISVGAPFDAQFQYVAILQNDQKTIRIRSFTEIEKEIQKNNKKSFMSIASGLLRLENLTSKAMKLFSKEEVEYSDDLIHEEDIKKYILVKNAPLLISQTSENVYLWSSLTGELLDKISIKGLVDFSALTHMGIIAITNKEKELTLYSIPERKILGSFPGFSPNSLGHRIHNWSQKEAFITLDNGQLLKIEMPRSDASSSFAYQIKDLNFNISMKVNQTAFSVVETTKDRYVIIAYSTTGNVERTQSNGTIDLLLDIYSLKNKTLVHTYATKMNSTFKNFVATPDRQGFFYTATEEETGFIRLKALLVQLGL